MRVTVLALAALALASPSAAQHSAAKPYALDIGFRVPIGRASRPAPLCDGSEMASVRSQKNVGKVLIFGGLGVALASQAVASGSVNGSRAIGVLSAGAIAAVVGLYFYNSANPSDAFWEDAVSRIKVGETREDDVRQCLGPPSSIVQGDSGETWGYGMAKSGLLGLGGSTKTVAITFKDGVASHIQKTGISY